MNRRRVRPPRTLGDLPSDRKAAGKRVLDPGTHYVTDWINRHTLSLYPFTIDTTPERIIPANHLRTYLGIQNKSGGTIFVNFGQNPTQYASVQIPAGGNYIFEGGATGGAFVPQDDVYVLGSVAGLDGVIAEGAWMPQAQENL